MRRILIFGNSGSGKSTLAKKLCSSENLAHLDLDTLAWEPHKYESKEAQDANLGMLVDWISQYAERSDTFSQESHQKLFDDYAGEKTMLVRNETLT